jgi:hypothetical protein
MRAAWRPIAALAAIVPAAFAAPAAALPVRFEVVPGGADARIIPLANFRFCRIKRLDPWENACAGWRIVKPRMDLKGDYCVFAQWDAKNRHRSALNLAEGDEGGTIVIKPRELNKSVCS